MRISSVGTLVLWMISLGAARCLAATAADVDSLARQLRDPAVDVNGKGDVCLQLMDLGPAAAPAVPALVGLLTSPEEILRDYAVTTLDRIGPPARNALPALRRVAAQDGSPAIRELARAAIARISGAAAESEPAKPAAPVAPENNARPAPAVPAEPENATAPAPAVPVQPAIPSRPTTTISRPILEVHQGRYYRWATPVGWTKSESANGVTLTAPDGLSSVSAALLLRSPGPTNPVELTLWMLRMIPENGPLQVLGKRDLPDEPSGSGAAWRVQEAELQYATNGVPLRAVWTTGVMPASGAFDAFLLGYQAPPAKFAAARLWLAPIARSVVLTNPAQAAGTNALLTPRNQPPDDPALLESWRQRGLPEDRIARAQREGSLGYERVKDPQSGRIFEMPLEAWDETAGGYHDPQRPGEILQPVGPGE